MSIHTSEQNLAIVHRIKTKYNFQHYHIPARIGIAYSIQLGKKFKASDKPKDNNGTEFKEETLFGTIDGKSCQIVYKAILDQYYEKKHSEEEFLKLVKLHLDHGLENFGKEIFENYRGKNYHIDFLVNAIKNGLDFVSPVNMDTIPSNKSEFEAYKDLVSFIIGERENHNEVVIRLNDLNEYDSHHIAIAGMTGTGKTELVKDILFQISNNTRNEIKFIFLDYKGEGSSGKLKTFLNKTNCEFVNPLESDFNFNPLQYINLSNEKAKNFNINSFVDAIALFEPKIGPKQKYNFKAVLKMCFDSESGVVPTMRDVSDRLTQFYENNEIAPDTLLATVEDLSNGIFSCNSGGGKLLYNESIYLSLPQSLSDSIRQTTVFLVLNYILATFSETNDVKPNVNRINPLRYIIVIDEAHVYLRNKNARKLLEQLLRVIRSKGIVVIMLSQGPEDYRQPDFDFASQVKIPICLNVNNKAPKIIQRFIGWNKSENKLKAEIDKLENGKALINVNGIESIEIRQFWRTLQKYNIK